MSRIWNSGVEELAFIPIRVKGQSPWIPKHFRIIFRLKARLRESHYNFLQIQYLEFIGSTRKSSPWCEELVDTPLPTLKKIPILSWEDPHSPFKKSQSRQGNSQFINKFPLKLKKYQKKRKKEISPKVKFEITIKHHNYPTISCYPPLSSPQVLLSTTLTPSY